MAGWRKLLNLRTSKLETSHSKDLVHTSEGQSSEKGWDAKKYNKTFTTSKGSTHLSHCETRRSILFLKYLVGSLPNQFPTQSYTSSSNAKQCPQMSYFNSHKMWKYLGSMGRDLGCKEDVEHRIAVTRVPCGNSCAIQYTRTWHAVFVVKRRHATMHFPSF